MVNHKFYSLSAMLLLWVIIQGCGTTEPLEPDMQPNWLAEVPIDYLGTGYVTQDEERIVIGNDNDIYVLDAETGSVIQSYEEDFFERIRPDLEVSGISFEGAIADAYNLVPLDNTGTMLLFDYRFDEETVTALDTESGEIIWQNSDYEYSLGKYSDIIQAVAEGAARALAGTFGGQAQSESTYEQRERENNFIQNIIYEVPESSNFLFKTFDGIALMDGTDGSEIWKVPEFTGSGIADAKVLPDGDFLVLSGGQNLLDFEMAEAYHLARISPDGEARWISEHSGSHIVQLFASADQAIVDGAPTEAFDLETGEKLWENEAIYRDYRHHHMVVTDENLYVAGDLEARTVTMGQPGWVWEHDLETGEVLWHTEETRTEFSELILVDDVLLVRGDGELFEGNGGIAAIDANEGEQLWVTPEMEPFGWRGFVQEGRYYGKKVTQPFVYENTVYAAGPDRLYAIDLNSGDVLFESDHNEEHETGGTNGLAMYEDNIVLVGLDAVVAYNKDDGSVQYATEVESTSSFSVYDHHLVLRDGRERIGAFNLETGSLGPMMRSESPSGGRFGHFSNSIYTANDGSYVMVIQDNGSLLKFEL